MRNVLPIIVACVLSACATTSNERLLDRCSICDTAIAGTVSCPSCGVLVYAPTFLTTDEENAAQQKALDQLAKLPDGFEVFVSSSPTRKPSWTAGGLIRIEKAVGVLVTTGQSADTRSETEARNLASQNAQRGITESMLPVQWYVERSLRKTEAGVMTIYRAWVLCFGKRAEEGPPINQ